MRIPRRSESERTARHRAIYGTKPPAQRMGMGRRLLIYDIDGKKYFKDDRLQEYRNIDNPNDRMSFVCLDNLFMEGKIKKMKEVV